MDRFSAQKSLMELQFSILVPACLYVVTKLRVVDHIAAGMSNNEDLANEAGIQPRTFHRIMRLMCSHGVFNETKASEYALTPVSELLRSDIEGTVAPFLQNNAEITFDLLPIFLEALLQNKVPFDHRYGKPLFEWMSESQERVEEFQRGYSGIHWPETEAVISAYDFSNVKTFADIGGSHGEVVLSLLSRYEDLKAVIFDRPEVIEQTRNKFAELGMAERCAFQGGDFFERIPVEADCYFLRHILHDWNDEECVRILRNIVAGAAPGSRILIAECVIGETNQPDMGKLLDILMMTALTGMERTAAEFADLFEAADIKLVEIIPTKSIISVVEGVIT